MSSSPAAGLVLGVPRETQPGEARVALVPEVVTKLVGLGHRVIMERGAGVSAQFPDSAYQNVEFVDSAADVYSKADVLLKVQPLTPRRRQW